MSNIILPGEENMPEPGLGIYTIEIIPIYFLVRNEDDSEGTLKEMKRRAHEVLDGIKAAIDNVEWDETKQEFTPLEIPVHIIQEPLYYVTGKATNTIQ